MEHIFFGMEFQEGTYNLWTGIFKKEHISFRLFMMENIYSLGRSFKEEQLSFMLEFKERTFILWTGV